MSNPLNFTVPFAVPAPAFGGVSSAAPAPQMAPIPAPAPAPATVRTAPVATSGGNGRVDFASIFQPATAFKLKPRLAMSLEAMDKSGKSHYALFTAPEPIAVIFCDDGTPAVIEKAIKAGRKIAGVVDLRYRRPEKRDGSVNDKDSWQEWTDKWDLHQKAIAALIANPAIRTVVKDTESEMWDLCQLAHFGKMDKISQHLRVQCNNAYLGAFQQLYARDDLNIILIHQCKKEYKPNSKGEDSWTGQYERSGMNKIGFEVDICVRAGWNGQYKTFYTSVPQEQATRFGAEIAGRVWYGAESRFGYVGLECFPDTIMTPEVWGL